MTHIYNRPSEKQLRQQLRTNMPTAEVLLWSKLRGRQLLGQKFRSDATAFRDSPETKAVITTHATITNDRLVIQAVRDTLGSFPALTVHHDPDANREAAVGSVRPGTLNLHSSVVSFLDRRYASGLFAHQHEAIESVLAGHNTVVATRTSSGKSLIYSLPVFDALCRDPNATSLFIYPQKALANDQLIKLRGMAAEIDPVRKLLKTKPRLISRYDGSTPGDNRSEIRREVQVLLTNPDRHSRGSGPGRRIAAGFSGKMRNLRNGDAGRCTILSELRQQSGPRSHKPRRAGGVSPLFRR